MNRTEINNITESWYLPINLLKDDQRQTQP